MAVRIIWSPQASKDLKQAAAWIRTNNAPAARSFVGAIREKAELLSEFPQIGRVVPELKDAVVREVIYRQYRIVYFHRVEQKAVDIVRIWHSARGEPEL